MNIQFLSIDLENFRSIDKISVNLNNQGTVIVKGINEYEDNASSNGSGKSSMFEGIIYALFEETSSGEKDVENRIIGNGFKVKLELLIDNVKYTIYREGKNGKSSVILYKDNIDISARNKTDTNKLIINLLGISKSIFLDTIFLSQNAVTNLASLQPTARRERLEILTNTDNTINIFKEKIKQLQLEYEADRVNLVGEINNIEGKKQVLLNQQAQLKVKIEEINKEILRLQALGTIPEIEASIENNTNLINEKTNIINQLQEQVNTIEIIIKEMRDNIQVNLDEKTEINNSLLNINNEYTTIDAKITKDRLLIHMKTEEIEKINREIEKIKNSDTCPTCGRKYEDFNDAHLKLSIKEKEDEIENINKIINECNTNIETATKELENVRLNKDQINIKIADIDNIISNKNIEINNKENEKINLNKTIQIEISNKDLLQNEITVLQNKKEQLMKTEVNNKQEFEDMINNIDREIEDLRTEYIAKNDKLTECESLINSTKHMLQLITKEFRTYLLKNSLRYLNKVLKDYSNQLFSNEGDLISISEDDTKLDIKLGNATYESLSGGEKTRVNIALLLAQKSLAGMIGNMNCNMIILDEILGYCDSKAETKVIDLINKELETLESIYMISHKEIPVGYDSELIIVKDRSGLSRLRSY